MTTSFHPSWHWLGDGGGRKGLPMLCTRNNNNKAMFFDVGIALVEKGTRVLKSVNSNSYTLNNY